MAKYRPPEYCLQCGKQLTPIYRDQSNLPLMQRIIGDTFMGYKPCECSVKLPIKTEGEDVEIVLDAYREFIVRTGLIDRKNLQDFVKNLPSAIHSPVGIDVEELAEVFASSKFHGAKDETSELWLASYNAFKAGYAANENVNEITVEWLNKLKPDYDNKDSYQHGFHDAIDCVKKRVESIASPQSSTGGFPKLDQPILDEDDVIGIIIEPQSNKSIIEWTDFLGDMGWYKVKKTGRWEHDDEKGYFESTEDLVNHYLKESTPQSSTGGLPKLDEPILNDDDVDTQLSTSEEEEDLWMEVISEIEINDFISTKYEYVINNLRSKIKISRR